MSIDQAYISKARALQILRRDGDFTETQARIVLNNSHGQRFDGEDYYPLGYISKRAKQNAEAKVSK